MNYKLLFICLAGFAIDAYSSHESSFDKQTLKATRVQMHLVRKRAELQGELVTSPAALNIEILRIEKKLRDLTKNIPVWHARFSRFEKVQSILDSDERERKIADCVLYLTEKEIRRVN